MEICKVFRVKVFRVFCVFVFRVFQGISCSEIFSNIKQKWQKRKHDET